MSGTRWAHMGIGAVVAALAVALAGCDATEQITQTPFEQSASDAASIMAAASTTLQFVHSVPARMTVEYGAGSMINYDDRVSSVPAELPTLAGAPNQQTLASVVALLETAVADIEHPCLLPDCDWQTQVNHFDAARDALLKAVE